MMISFKLYILYICLPFPFFPPFFSFLPFFHSSFSFLPFFSSFIPFFHSLCFFLSFFLSFFLPFFLSSFLPFFPSFFHSSLLSSLPSFLYINYYYTRYGVLRGTGLTFSLFHSFLLLLLFIPLHHIHIHPSYIHHHQQKKEEEENKITDTKIFTNEYVLSLSFFMARRNPIPLQLTQMCF